MLEGILIALLIWFYYKTEINSITQDKKHYRKNREEFIFKEVKRGRKKKDE